MKFQLFLNQCLRSKEVRFSLLLLVILGVIGIFIGKRHLDAQEKAIEEVEAYQKQHFERHVQLHNDDLGLLLYYVKFAYINPSNPLAGISIGQSDVNPTIKRLTIKTFEAQKHDTDLINPMNLQSGNLDLSFVLIYLIPLLVIVLCFNVLSEEMESGTWRLVAIQAKSKIGFILTKLGVRMILILTVVTVLFLFAKVLLSISLNTNFLIMYLMSVLYVLFWFSLCFMVICLKKTSGFNALMLLSIWLVLIILLPAGINSYLNFKYPVPEALTAAISQRDGYHTKWDTEKMPTIKKFYSHYPQFEKYGYPTEGFNWLWYYAMQQMGDDDSKKERDALDAKINLREQKSQQIALWLPNMQMQMAFNTSAGTSLAQHLGFLDAAEDFHERLRLFFYPKIFEEQKAIETNWDEITPEHYKQENNQSSSEKLLPILLASLIMVLVSVPLARQM